MDVGRNVSVNPVSDVGGSCFGDGGLHFRLAHAFPTTFRIILCPIDIPHISFKKTLRKVNLLFCIALVATRWLNF